MSEAERAHHEAEAQRERKEADLASWRRVMELAERARDEPEAKAQAGSPEAMQAQIPQMQAQPEQQRLQAQIEALQAQLRQQASRDGKSLAEAEYLSQEEMQRKREADLEAEAPSVVAQQRRIAELHRAKIYDLYKEFNPKKISDLPAIFREWQGKEEQLLQAVRQKYPDSPNMKTNGESAPEAVEGKPQKPGSTPTDLGDTSAAEDRRRQVRAL